MLLLVLRVQAVTYYIDTSSTGSGDGTTTATSGANAAWKAFSEITGLAPGDFVLLNRGDTWRLTLTVPTSGSAGSPITFGTYGTGNDPIINGADVMLTWVDSAQGLGSTWKKTGVTTEPRIFLSDGIFLTEGSGKTALNDHEWVWDTDELFYRDDSGDPDGLGITFEGGQRNDCLGMDNKNYITVDSLAIKHANGTAGSGGGGGAGIRVNRSAGSQIGTIIRNCTISNCSWAGIGMLGMRATRATDMLIENNTISNNSFFDIASGGASSGAISFVYMSNSIIRNNTISGDQEHGIRARRVNNCTISDNTCFNNGSSGIAVTKTGFVDADQVSTNNIVERNLCYDNATVDSTKSNFSYVGANGTPGNNIFRNNISYGGVRGFRMSGSDTDFIYNNTIYNSSSEGIVLDGSTANCTVKNNIFSTAGAEHIKVDAGSITGNNINNNCYGDDGVNNFDWNGTNYNFADWKTNSSQDDNSILQDPQFVDAAGNDFHLKSNSPCITAGVDVGLTEDFDGIAIKNPPDIGAYSVGYSNEVLRGRYRYLDRAIYRTRYR